MKHGAIRVRGNKIRFKMPARIFPSGNVYVAICPMLRLASHGRTEYKAKVSLRNVVLHFLEDLIEMKTLAKVLKKLGWVKKKTLRSKANGITIQPVPVNGNGSNGHASLRKNEIPSETIPCSFVPPKARQRLPSTTSVIVSRP